METDVEDFLMEDDNQFSLEEMENALQNNDNIQLSSDDSQKSVLKELNRSPVKRGRRLAASKPVTYYQISSDSSGVNNSGNSSDNSTKQPVPKKKRIQGLKKPVAKKKCMDKENISENVLETNNRPALLDRTNCSKRSTKFPKKGKDANSDKDLSFAKDGKDLITNEKVVTETSVPVKETKTEKPIPVYKQALDNVRLTPPPVDNKLDLYEFEIDENEQPVTKKKKRKPRVMKSRKKIATNPVENALQNIVVPQRTIGLRCDNTVRDKNFKSKAGVVRFDIVKSIEKHTDALERNKVLPDNTSINPRSIVKCAYPQKRAMIQSTPVRKSQLLSGARSATTNNNNVINRRSIELQKSNNPVANQSELDSDFDFLIYVNNERKDNLPHVTVFKNMKENSFEEGACCGWDENLQPVLVLDDTISRTKALTGSVQNGKQRYAELLRKLKENSFEGACRGWDENLQPVPDHSTSSSKNSCELHPTSKPSTMGRDANDSKVMDRSANDPSRFDTSDASMIFESAVLGRDHNDTDFAFVNSFELHETTVDERKDDSKSIPANISLQKVTLRNKKANQSGVQIRQNMSKNQSANQSVIDRQNNRTVHHPIPLIRSVNPAANKVVANASKIDLDYNFGFDDCSDDVIEDKISSSNTNLSVPISGSTNQVTNRTDQEISVRNESKIGGDDNFGFDCDSTNSVDVNRDTSKKLNTSAASTSNTSISSVSTSSRLEAEQAKKPEAQVSDVIRRLKRQLNITAVSTPVSTKQTKLNFNFKNKSTVSNDSAADTSICSPIAQQNSTDNGAMTPTFLKPPRKSYSHTPKAKKAVRFGTSFAFDQNELKDDDDDDAADEDLFEDTFREKVKPKKVNQTYKKAGKAVKKEEKEIERLVSAINSQFQKVEEFELCVEK